MAKRRYLKYWKYHKQKEDKMLNCAYRRYWSEWMCEQLEIMERITWGLPSKQ